MKIVHYLGRFRLADGGVVRAVLDICALLAQHGHEVDIITWNADDVPAEWKAAGAALPRIHELDSPGRPAGFLRRAQMDSFMSIAKRADVLHLHTPWDPPNLQISAAARRAGLPYVVTVHGMLDDWCMSQKSLKKRLYLAMGARAMLEGATVVHCTAEAELEQAKRWFPRGRGTVIPLIFDLEAFRTLPGVEPAERAFGAARTDERIILYLSRLHPKKSVEVLIDAVGILRAHGEPLRLLIAGSGDEAYENSLRRRAAEAHLDGHVFFLGLVTGVEKVSLYERADLFVLPTSQENFGFVLIEALAAATPVITTKGVDIWPELETSGGGLIVDRSAVAIANAMKELLQHPDHIRQMGRAGRDWVLDEFEGDAIVRRFEEMYARTAATALRETSQ